MYQQDNRDAYFERKEEEKEARRDRWRLTMGLMEFLAVVAGVAVTLVLVLLIVIWAKKLRPQSRYGSRRNKNKGFRNYRGRRR